MSKPKIILLDTNIIIDSWRAPTEFEDNIVVIPKEVIGELHKFKSENSDRGVNARGFFRLREQLARDGDLIKDGVSVNDKGGVLKEFYLPLDKRDIVSINVPDIGENDINILRCAKFLEDDKEHNPNKYQVEFVTNDIALRGSALINKINAKSRIADAVDLTKLYTGYSFIQDEYAHELFLNKDMVELSDLISLSSDLKKYELEYSPNSQEKETEYDVTEKIIERDEFYKSLLANEFIVFTDQNRLEESLLKGYRYGLLNDKNSKIVKLVKNNESHYFTNLDWKEIRKLIDKTGIAPRNVEQAMALDLSLNDKLDIVVLYGNAGTGKTLMGVVAGWYTTQHTKKGNSELLFTKPHSNVGKEEYGYLPGDLIEKVIHNYSSVNDAFDIILEKDDECIYGENLDDILNDPEKRVRIQPLGYVRGINIKKRQFFIGEEFQNTTHNSIKTITSRLNDGAKAIYTGDPNQTDGSHIRAEANGLTHFIDTVMNNQGHVYTKHIACLKMDIVERGRMAHWSQLL